MSKETDRVTYPELLNFYYDCGFPSILKANANSVAHAIIYKWNKLWQPESFSMSNAELYYLSGVDSHIERLRQKVLDRCKVDKTPLFVYTPGTTHRAGIYKINTTLLPKTGHFNPTLLPETGHFNAKKDRDPNTIKYNEMFVGSEGEQNLKKEEKEKAIRLLAQWGLKAKDISLENYDPEYVSHVIETIEIDVAEGRLDNIDNMAGYIVSIIRNEGNYAIWKRRDF